MPTALHLIRASYLNFIIKSMESGSITTPTDSLLEKAELNAEQLNGSHKLILETKVWHFLALAAESQNMPHLGMHVVERSKLDESKEFSGQLLGAGNLYQALQLLVSKANFQNNNNALWLQESEECMWVCRPHYPKCQHSLWQIEQVTMSLICMLVAYYAGAGWFPKQVKFQDVEGKGTDESRFFKHTKIELGQRFSAIAIDHALLKGRVPSIKAFNEPKLEKIPDTFTKAFKVLLKQNYFGQDWLAEDIAATLEMSVRTLKRKLRSQNTSLREVFDEVRFQQACDLIEQDVHDYKLLAEKLSYTHPNNFVRAFKRWSGVTPREYIRLRQIELLKINPVI